MGSPISAFGVVAGYARVPFDALSAEEWCTAIDRVISRVRPYLKDVSGFKTLAELLSGELVKGCQKFRTEASVVPSFEKTGLDAKTRFVVLHGRREESGYQISWSVLLLTDAGYFVILDLACFKHADCYAVCKASLTAIDSISGRAGGLDTTSLEIRSLIEKKQVRPYGLLDTLYLLLEHTATELEERLRMIRGACDHTRGVRDRICMG